MDSEYLSGTLACLADCNGLDVSGCETRSDLCGNGRLDPIETCDGSLLAGLGCVSLGWGYLGGELGCRATCDAWDTARCEPLCSLRWEVLRQDGEGFLPYRMELDHEGNVVVMGVFHGSVTFGSVVLQSEDYQDTFLAKLGPQGQFLWSRSFNTWDSDSSYHAEVKVDRNGDILLFGPFSDTLNLGGEDLVADSWLNLFAAKVSASGDHLWSRRVGGDGPHYTVGLTEDASGNAVVVGVFGEILDFGDATLVGEQTGNLFIASLESATGGHLWSRVFGSADGGFAYPRIALDPSGQIVLAGGFWGRVSLGGAELEVTCSDDPGDSCRKDLFLAKLDPGGEHLWSRSIQASGDSWFHALVSDGQGNIFVAGDFYGYLDFGGSARLSSLEKGWLFLAKLDPDGQHLWSNNFFSQSVGMAVDEKGRVAVAASLFHPITFGGATFGGDGMSGLALAIFDEDGGHLWSDEYLGDGRASLSGLGLAFGPGGQLTWGGSVYHFYDPEDPNNPAPDSSLLMMMLDCQEYPAP